METITKVLVGSRLHGLANEQSDYDYRGIHMYSLKDTKVASIIEHYYTIFVSGRSEDYREETEEWLKKYNYIDPVLFMRASGDTRNDAIVKKELYEAHIKGKFNVSFVLDDRDRVVDMWRNELGLKVLQCAEGDF